MNPADFVATYGPPADWAASATGLNRWTILTQWALETGWCAPNSGCPHANLAGISCHGGCPCNSAGFCTYGDAWAFAADYAGVLHNGMYGNVLSTAGYPHSLRIQMYQLGRSPWAGSHYDDGSGAGSLLMDVYEGSLQGLAGMDLDEPVGPNPPPPSPPQPAPQPVPPPPPGPPPPVPTPPGPPPVADSGGGDLAAAAVMLAGAGVVTLVYAHRVNPSLFHGLQLELTGAARRLGL